RIRGLHGWPLGGCAPLQSHLCAGPGGQFIPAPPRYRLVKRGDFESYRWTELYRRIRQVNLFFENIDEVPFDGNEGWRERMKGEVHFLNAYFYHNLVRLHGGVPIVERTFDLSDDFLVARSSLADCIDYIVSECDKAAAILPLQHDDPKHIGRATRGAA